MSEFWLRVIGGFLVVIFAVPQVAVIFASGEHRLRIFGVITLSGVLLTGYFVITEPRQVWQTFMHASMQTGQALMQTVSWVYDLFAPDPDAAEPGPSPASDSTTREPPAWGCPDEYVCSWEGVNGTGKPCQWNTDDPDWLHGDYECKWADSRDGMVVRNNRFNSILWIYAETNYHGPNMCVAPGDTITRPKTSTVRSHRWTTGSCD